MSIKPKTYNPPCNKIRYIFIFALAAALRYMAMTSKYQKIIANHIEISTPLSSWKRVLEGTFLFSKGINPYDGDLLHETPLSLHFYKLMLHLFGNVHLMFIVFDLSTALLLLWATSTYAQWFTMEHKNEKLFPEDVRSYLPGADFSDKVREYVVLAYLFNPYSLLGCVGHCTVGINNFFLALFMCGMVHGSVVLSSLAWAVCATTTFYPLIIIIPLIMYFVQVHKSTTKAVGVVLLGVGFIVGIIMFDSDKFQDFSYINNVYGCILTVPDLQPNIGLFWYFFTEMFDHFRELFIWSFQINATILYLIPLSIRFRNQPFILTVALLFLISIFKSYPCVSDLGFALSLLPSFLHLVSFYQQDFVISVILLMTSTLAPVLWHLWIYSASANANFYFGVTLAYAIAQIFLVTDLLFAQTKWEFSLKHGKETRIGGEQGVLSLE